MAGTEPITPAFLQICGDTGIDIDRVRRNLATFKDLEALLKKGIEDADAALTQYQWARMGEVLAVGIKHLCDKTLFAASLLAGPGGATVIGILYDQAQLAVKAGYEGVDGWDIANTTGDKWLAVAEYGAQQARTATASKVGGVLGAVATVKSIFNMANELHSWWESSGKHANGGAGIRSARQTLKRQLADIRSKIRDNRMLLFYLEQRKLETRGARLADPLLFAPEGPACRPPRHASTPVLECSP
ncbi:MAG: hypothetical protein AAF918_16275 [Pseudomonadota bacterium]